MMNSLMKARMMMAMAALMKGARTHAKAMLPSDSQSTAFAP